MVRLPDGTSKQWGDIKIDDLLFSPSKGVVKVIDIPMDGIDDIYKITLKDGRTVEASGNHIWNVYTVKDAHSTLNMTTRQMCDMGVKNKYGQHNFSIP